MTLSHWWNWIPQEQMKQLETKTFEEISKTTQNREEYKEDPLVSKSQTSIKNPNASFQFHMNASASSFETSALFYAKSFKP